MISLEIVPRSREALAEGIALAEKFPEIKAINIPDLSRFSLRAWELCAEYMEAGNHRFSFIPHLKANAFDPAVEPPFARRLAQSGVRALLAVQGDPPREVSEPYYDQHPTCDFIRTLKREVPKINVYAAFDPYRNNIRYELDYLLEKKEAGADGFMSQPFFDLRLLEIYAEYLEGKEVWWGVAPVLSEKSKAYWESRNRAIFPRSFKPTLDWNLGFARDVHAFCQENKFKFYLMPIRVDLESYLSGLFA